MKKLQLSIFALVIAFTFSCKNNEAAKDETKSETETNEVKTEKISLTPLEGSPAYADSKLMLDGEAMLQVNPGENTFNFAVENYELGIQTPNAGDNGLANSAKGQHIHVIMDNKPYSAHYTTEVKKDIPEGDHVMLAFLSRSYHESVKNADAVVVKKITAGNPADSLKMNVDLSAPHLFYSRPKGTYKGEDVNKVLLDFYLVNTEISEDGNKVLATINGEEFTITEWQPYVMEGLPLGENTIELQLVDENNQPIDGPFNYVKRTVMLEK
ncbi:hypothetical protein [Psychroflexus sp. ALD_RP9]|uniref:hypothetical protein n=1 Tax=Psychroflexus sp. ALD_RP9 TaxID=2777186 RepID=UPI001A8CF8EF|nr:hypothetical protein [Psychroflexus sp. ALD_RP9]QSS97398.1 hypothetical protein IMZ30_01400 [Psychroflexus sp. ALD_RP9]